jgi:alkanesulfonate monooxygenase SsuD/methylene tetrahydromethanopterin reductase-like flavin-dependent oxidoreductase (luciferase family)
MSDQEGDMNKVGLSLPNRGVLFGATTVDELYALSERAEASGLFHSLWVGDGLIAKPRLEAIATLSALAARTERLMLGVCCMATFPLRNPVLFACQWASLDVISNGRSLLAVCLGAPTGRGGSNFAAELAAMNVDGRTRVRRMEEAIEVVRKTWAGAASHDGSFWNFTEIDLEPKPVQQPCPIWIASNPDPDKLSPARYQVAIDRVARMADGWLSTVVSPQDFGRRLDEIRSSMERFDRTPEMPSALHLMINLQNDVETARREAKRFLDQYYMTDTKAETMDVWGAYGTVDDVLARIDEYRQAGCELPIVRFASFDQKGQLERGLEELIPRLVQS